MWNSSIITTDEKTLKLSIDGIYVVKELEMIN